MRSGMHLRRTAPHSISRQCFRAPLQLDPSPVRSGQVILGLGMPAGLEMGEPQVVKGSPSSPRAQVAQVCGRPLLGYQLVEETFCEESP